MVTRAEENVYLDALAFANALYRDTMPANTILLGAAWQRGLVPISLDAMLEAFRLNGVAVERTTAAFNWGRAVVARPEAVTAVLAGEVPAAAVELSERERSIVAGVGAPAGSELERLLEVRVPELVAYQSVAYAREYAEFVARVLAVDAAAAEAVARELFRLMAYKDEYEVARLHLDPVERARLAAQFGEGAKIAYKLHPPVLRALGMKRKIALGRWFDGGFRLLRAMKRLRGTRLDPFGYAGVRRVERELVEEYRAMVERALPHAGDPRVLELCELPAMVRGYEHVKLRNVEAYRARAVELEASWTSS
jgi:indolepyruvate ferredoxin oxidoreductase